MNAQRKGGNRGDHQKADSQSKTGGAGGPSTGGAKGDRTQAQGGGAQKQR